MRATSSGRLLRDTAVLSELTGRIYDAAGDPGLWNPFLDRLRDVLELRAANILITSDEPDGFVAALPAYAGLDDSNTRDYAEHFSHIDPHRIPGASLPSGTVCLSTDLVSDDELVRTEYFNDFYSKAGMRNAISAVIHNERGVMSVLGCHRGHDQPPPDADDVEFLRLLTPHLQRARILSARLGTLGSNQRVVSDVLDRLPIGLIFVDATGVFLRANAHGEKILEQQDGLGMRHGRLIADDMRATRELHAVIANACTGSAASSARLSTRLERASGRRPIDVMAYPIDVESRIWSDGLAAAFLLINDGEVPFGDVARRLRDLYGLSAIEANLSTALASGATVQQCAEERGVSVETVRWQLKQVFAKTGTSRQSDLIRLVLTGPGLMR